MLEKIIGDNKVHSLGASDEGMILIDFNEFVGMSLKELEKILGIEIKGNAPMHLIDIHGIEGTFSFIIENDICIHAFYINVNHIENLYSLN